MPRLTIIHLCHDAPPAAEARALVAALDVDADCTLYLPTLYRHQLTADRGTWFYEADFEGGADRTYETLTYVMVETGDGFEFERHS